LCSITLKCIGLSCPSLFRCKFIMQRGFAMVFHLWVYCTLISLAPSTTLICPFSPTPIIQQLSLSFIVPSSYTDVIVFQYYSLSIILFFHHLPIPSLLKQSCYWKHAYIYVYIWSYLYLCIFLSLGSILCIWEKHLTFVFLNLPYFT
jgi:hypothetical protein